MARKRMAPRGTRSRPVQEIELALSDQRALELRLKGWTYAQIAGELSYGTTPESGKAGARKAVMRALEARGAENREELRRIENARLDVALAPVMRMLQADDDDTAVKAITALTRLSKRRSELNGLDEAPQAPVGPDGKPAVPQITVIYEDARPSDA